MYILKELNTNFYFNIAIDAQIHQNISQKLPLSTSSLLYTSRPFARSRPRLVHTLTRKKRSGCRAVCIYRSADIGGDQSTSTRGGPVEQTFLADVRNRTDRSIYIHSTHIGVAQRVDNATSNFFETSSPPDLHHRSGIHEAAAARVYPRISH